jgi:hypothetical protein
MAEHPLNPLDGGPRGSGQAGGSGAKVVWRQRLFSAEKAATVVG